MKITGIATLDHAPHDVNAWLTDVCTALGWQEKGRVYLLLRTVLHAVRDWLTVDEAAQLAAQLPILMRGIYYEGWNPSDTPVHPRNKSDFVARIAHPFAREPLDDTEAAISAVLGVFENHVSSGENEQAKHAMRASVRALWP